jgi:hypothetical protein
MTLQNENVGGRSLGTPQMLHHKALVGVAVAVWKKQGVDDDYIKHSRQNGEA